MRAALVDADDEVVNLVVADEGYTHPTYTVIDTAGARVDIGDYYDPDTDEFFTAQFEIDAPNTIPNDGTAVTVDVTTTARSEQPATFEVADYTETITVTPTNTTQQDISTTAAVGSKIDVRVSNDDIEPGRAVIEVTAP